MASTQLTAADLEEAASPGYEFTPTFYVCHHDSKRALPVTSLKLYQAQETGYDSLTSPITTPHFHSRVLTLLSEHLARLSNTELVGASEPPAPIIPPLDPDDTPLTPGDLASSLIAYSSPWIDLGSADPLISNISRQVLSLEVAYAAFCGINNIIIPGPRHLGGQTDGNGVIQYARAIKECLNISGYINISLHIPMYDAEDANNKELMIGDLAPFAREHPAPEASSGEDSIDLFGAWDAWHAIRSVCKYNSRLSAALALPKQMPLESLQSRWFSEPLRMLSFSPSTFRRNSGGHPALDKHQKALISRYMRLKQQPWVLLCDVGPIPDNSSASGPTGSAIASPNPIGDPSTMPTPAEAAKMATTSPTSSSKPADPAPHLTYIRYLQRNQPPLSPVERFGAGYQDYLQAPLQPLTDNLESITYEVFEKDPVKYAWYEFAISRALLDWQKHSKPMSSACGTKVVIAVAGSGRGPLVTRALKASADTGIAVEVWAVEKNPNAYVLLQRHNAEEWNNQVTVVKSDMRSWPGPLLPSEANEPPKYGKIDILVSELLGSFADNELSPECLDGIQHVLSKPHGISIPQSYTAHLAPIAAPKLFADISFRQGSDEYALETPYVVMLHAIDFNAARGVPDAPRIQQCWEFSHPIDSDVLKIAEQRRQGGVSGGGGGSMAGGEGANEHNSRYARKRFVCRERGVCHGLAGYFETVLYDGGEDGCVELSTRPDTMEEKSPDMISWFPMFFPLKNPLYFPDDSELEVTIWRQTDDRKVWYEWLVEAFVMVGPNKRIRLGISEMSSSRQVGCLM